MITIKLPLTDDDACMHLRHWATRRSEGRTPEFTTDDFEHLLAWVRREMEREVDTAACMLEDTDGPDDEQAFREALTHCVALALGGPFVEDDRLARTLCEAAATRFGGWPS